VMEPDWGLPCVITPGRASPAGKQLIGNLEHNDKNNVLDLRSANVKNIAKAALRPVRT